MAEENRTKLTDEALEQVSGGARGAERSAPKRRKTVNETIEQTTFDKVIFPGTKDDLCVIQIDKPPQKYTRAD